MAKVIGYNEKVFKEFTCYHCAAIVQYAPYESKPTDKTDEGRVIYGLNCPNCGNFYRTNP